MSSSGAPHASLAYRPEIDGLRAISVLGVLLYHANLGIGGGYVGVDVFFVISGFLITGILVRDLQAGSFTLANFWVRRVRRILPAAMVAMGGTLLVGCLLLAPSALRSLSLSSIFQSIFCANFYFWRDTGYFSVNAEYKPLLHTWSLAVEEQFYLLFPLLLVVIFRWFRGVLVLALLVAILVSLLLCVWQTPVHSGASFFLLPTRAWEMLAGALLASLQSKIRLSARVAELMSALGLGMILYAMFAFDAKTLFPGVNAALPVLGTVLFIAACKSHVTVARRCLSLPPVVFVGLISYSLYLWHWPLFSFAKHLIIDITLGYRVALVLASMLLGVLSWKFVESPFRGGSLLRAPRAAFRFALSTGLILLLSSAIIYQQEGFPGRFSPHLLSIANDVSWNGSSFASRDGRPRQIGLPRVEGVLPDFVLWGDSHGMALARVIDERARGHGLAGDSFLLQGQIPAPGLYSVGATDSTRQAQLDAGARVFRYVIDNKVPHLLLVGRWDAYCSGPNRVEREHGGLSGTEGMITDSRDASAYPFGSQNASKSLGRRLSMMLERLSSVGTTTWILKQVPEANTLDPGRHFFLSQRFSFIEPPLKYSITLQNHRQRQKYANEVFSGLQSPLLRLIDATAAFFPRPESRLQIYSERSYFRDDDHLTDHGAEVFIGPVLDGVFREIADSE